MSAIGTTKMSSGSTINLADKVEEIVHTILGQFAMTECILGSNWGGQKWGLGT